MKTHQSIVAGLAMTALSMCAQSEIYTWTDAQNRVHFSDKKPADAKTQVVTPTINTYSSPEVSKSRWTPPPQPKTRAAVTMYSAAWCGVCQRAHDYFVQQNIPFNEYDVETTEQGKNDFAAMGGRGVPIILVNDFRMNGFSAEQFDQLYQQAGGLK
jgi:glutaredoxin